MTKVTNFNQLEYKTSFRTNGANPFPQVDYSLAPTSADVEVVFRNHRQKLIEFIQKYDCILGAVAWFTDIEIVNALRGK